jgi:WD40 repeat protein
MRRLDSSLHNSMGPAFVAWVCAASFTVADSRAQDLDFYKDVFPALESNCVSCHNKTSAKAGLNLESPESILKGGDSGPALIPGKGVDSLIVKSAAHQTDTAMPPKNNKSGAVDLSAAQLERLSKWIDQGARTSVKESKQVVWKPLPAGVSPIYSVALTADGKLAACARDSRVFLYNLQTQKLVGQLADPNLMGKETASIAHQSVVQSIAFNADGTRLATGGFREVKIWKREITSGSVRALSALQAQPRHHTLLTPDGKWMVHLAQSGEVELSEAASGKSVRTFQINQPAGPKVLRISPESSLLLVASENAAGGIWALTSGGPISFADPIPPLTAANFSEDGKILYAVTEGKTVQIFEISAGSGVWKGARTLQIQSEASIRSVHQGPTPDTLLVHLGEKLLLWSIAQQKPMQEFKSGTITCVSPSADMKQVAVGSGDGTVRVFEAESAKQLHEFRGTAANAAKLATLDWENNRAALDITFQKGVLAKLETESKDLENHAKKTGDAVTAAKKALPDKTKALATASESTAAAKKANEEAQSAQADASDVKATAALAAKRKETAAKLDAAMTAEKSAAAALVAVENAIRDGNENLQRIEAGKTRNTASVAASNAAMEASKASQTASAAKIAELKRPEANPSAACVSVKISADGSLIAAVLRSGFIEVWSTATGAAVESVFAGRPVVSAELQFTAAGRFECITPEHVLVCTSQPQRWLLERIFGKPSGDESIAERACAVRFSPDGKTLAVGSGEFSRSGDVHLWDVDAGKLAKVWRERHKDAVLSLDFSSDGKWLASGSADRLAKVTEIATGKQIHALEAHTHHVMGVSFRADDKALASSGADGVVNVWDMQSGERKKKITGWSKEVTALQYMGATSQIVASSGDNQVRIVADDGTEVRAMTKLPEFMQSAASAQTASVIVAGGEDSALRVWDSTSGKELMTFSHR